jgi:hypothetical protein
MTESAALLRVMRVVRAARRIADPADPLGERARRELPELTGLSLQGVEHGLSCCLETRPSEHELERLLSSVGAASGASVLLSANVFVAALRAIALALASSENVVVRASRREHLMAELLLEASDGAFSLTDELTPSAGDHVWAYGTDDTMAELRRTLPRGVVLHAHGAGIGVAFVEGGDPLSGAARALAEDMVAFDQRGCLSPRIAFVKGEVDEVRAFADELASALAEIETRIPRGKLAAEEAAAERRFRDALSYAGELIAAGSGALGIDVDGRLAIVAPVGRNLTIVRAFELERQLRPLAGMIAAAGVAERSELAASVSELLPAARLSPLGQMQRPPFDGPVDRRAPSDGELL